MKLWENFDCKCYVYDIETCKSLFYALFYDMDKDIFIEFECSKTTNNLLDMVKFIDDNKSSYFISYNGLHFDSVIINYIIANISKESYIDITLDIYKKAQMLIKDDNNSFVLNKTPFGNQLDLMKILHYDNKNRADFLGESSTGMVSLKRIQYEMDEQNIEENPIDFNKDFLTDNEILLEKAYCRNDVITTKNLFLNVLGQTEHPSYKGNNQIELRYNLIEEFKIPCMNYSDAKIGDEIIKTAYAQELGIDYYKLPQKGTYRRIININNCIPKFIKFQTPLLIDFLKSIKKMQIDANEEFSKNIEIDSIIHDIKKGGIHSRIKNKVYSSDTNYQLVDIDVSSFYAIATILSNKSSKHLNFTHFIKAYIKLYVKRVTLKPLSKSNSKIKGIVEGCKNALVAIFGKSGDIDSWSLDKELMYSITLGGQMIILQLIELWSINNFKTIMSNTDGALVIVQKTRLDEFRKICDSFCENMNSILKDELNHPDEVKFILEESLYKKIIFSNVNNYLAILENGSTKYKGQDFKVDYKFHENKSAKVVNLAVNEYFIKGTKPEIFLRSYKNIYDFTLRVKSSNNFYYQLEKDGEKRILKQLVRHFISIDGYILKKIKSENCITNAPPISNCYAPDESNYQPLVYYCNNMPNDTSYLLSKIDYYWYIDKAYKVIDQIEGRILNIKSFKTRRPSQSIQGLLF